MEVRGARYVNADNESLAVFIAEQLPYLDFEETVEFYNRFMAIEPYQPDDWALLGCNDRYFLLTCILNRQDALHPWLFERCREVEADPDGYLDLWARFHYKSTIITFAGTIQEILCDPEITIGIFAATNPIAKPFLNQIKFELETNELLKVIYSDVLYEEPKKQAPQWNKDGITVKRKSNPKECTVEAYGLIEGLPTGRHFRLLVFDDLVNERLARNPEQIRKTTEQWELSSPLGVGEATRKWHIGTRYSFADTYGIILDRKVLKPRLYPATSNGRREGKPVFMSQEGWDKTKIEMGSQVAAQMLQNPSEGKEATFSVRWFRPYWQRPIYLNIYILCDPSAGIKRKNTDNTAMAVIGIDTLGNKYLLDGYRHKMNLTERWRRLRGLWKKWSNAPGVQMVRVGYERYGMQSDLESFEKEMQREEIWFEIEEINWPREGDHSKTDRIQRLQPDMELGRLFIPGYVWHEVQANDDDMRKRAIELGKKPPAKPLVEWYLDDDTEQIQFRSVMQPTPLQTQLRLNRQEYLMAKPIQRVAEDDGGSARVYDLTRAFIEECRFHPFSPRDDLIDCASRVYDMDPLPAVPFEADTVEEHNHPD